MPSVNKVRRLYKKYHAEVWPDWQFNETAWDAFEKDKLCAIPFSQPHFFLTILAIWTGKCCADLKESFHYMSLFINMKGTQEESGHVEVENGDDGLVTKALSRSTKIWIVCMVLIPKCLIAMILWFLGARWLASTTSFQDLMLNAIALSFIMELDELVYLVAIPIEVIELVKSYKMARPVEDQAGDDSIEGRKLKKRKTNIQIAVWVAFMLLSLATVACVPIIYTYKLQHVMPDYKWDVHDHCEKWKSEQNFSSF